MNRYDYKDIQPFKWFVLENFPFIEADFDALTNWQLFCKIGKEINKIIASQNEVGNTVEIFTQNFINLYNYVHDYFDNLDVQEEINNKLDEMAEDGTLQEIIADYLNSKAIFAFDTVDDMINSTNLINGSYARTYGFNNINDGGGALYKIRTITNNDDTSYNSIIPMESDETLVAEIINYDEFNVLQYGINSETTDCSTIVQKIVDNAPSGSTIIFPPQTLNFNSAISLSNNQKLYFKGTRTNSYNQSGVSKLVFNEVNGFTNCSKTTFEAIEINGTNQIGYGFTGSGMRLINCQISNFNVGVRCNYNSVVIEKCEINRNVTGIQNPVDSRISNTTINANTSNGITLQAGSNDNIITNCKIEWNEGIGVSCYQGTHNIVSNCIFDRNTTTGLKFSNTARNVICNNMFRRNGVNETPSFNYSNMILETVSHSTIVGNTTATGNSRDDNTGFTCPGYALYLITCNNLMLVGNDFTGGTQSNPISNYNPGDNVSFIDVSNPPINLLRTLTTSKAIPNTESNTYNIPLALPTQNALPKYMRLVATYRANDESSYGIKEFYIYAYVQYSNISVALSESTIKENLTMSVAYDETNGFVITVTNNTGKKYNVKIDRYDL